MAFAFANAIAYVEAVLAHGVAVDDFAPRLSWIFNTHTNFFEEIAKYRALRRMWATHHARPLRRPRPALAAAAHAHADRRLDADAAAAREQHRARGAAGARGGARRRAVARALLLRRGDRDPDRARADARGAHAADPGRGDRRDRHRRSARRLVLRRGADRRARAPGAGSCWPRWSASAERSRRSRRASTSARSTRRPTARRWRSSRASASSSASTATARATIPSRSLPGRSRARRAGQIARLASVRAARDGAAVESALAALRADLRASRGQCAARDRRRRARRATLGEICGAMREMFGEYKPA